MFSFAACAFCATVAAVSPTPKPTAAPPEIAHVYTAERTDVTLRNSARTTYVVTRAQIERNGYRTVAQALQDVPALTVSPFGAIGSSANLTLRGSSSAQVLVLVDGLPAPGSLSNTVELGNMPTAGVDRIEIVEGGGSTLYGTGSIGGIINVITQRSAHGAATARIGSFGDRELEIDAPNVQYDRVVSANAFALPGGGVRPDADYESTALHGNLARRAGNFDLSLRAGIESDHLGAPGPDGAFLSPSTRENDQNQNADLTVVHRSLQAQATLQLGASEQRVSYWCTPAIDANCFQPSASLNEESRTELDLRDAVRGANEQLLYGADFSRGNVRGDNGGFGAPPIAYGSLAQSAAYVQQHVATRWGGFYGGLRGERDGAYGGEFSPSAGFVLRSSAAFTIKGNLATAFRAPNGSELYFPAYGNPALHPERAKVADLTITDVRAPGGLSLAWFGNRTNDLILAEPVAAPGPACVVDASSFTYEPCNVAHTLIEGLTLVAGTAPSKGFSVSLELTDLYRAENIDSATRLPNDPVFSASLRLDYAGGRESFVRFFGVAARSEGARLPFALAVPPYDRSSAFTSIDAYAGFRATPGLEIALRGYDLGNERYAAVSGFPMPGRSYLVELRVK